MALSISPREKLLKTPLVGGRCLDKVPFFKVFANVVIEESHILSALEHLYHDTTGITLKKINNLDAFFDEIH